MGKREYGSGSFYQRASDGMWVGTVEAGYTKDGGRRRITVSSRDKGTARRKLRDKLLQIDREGMPTTGARTTVKKFADDWIDTRKTQVRTGPWRTDASAVRRWIVPTIGHRRLDELTPADVRAVTKAQRTAGLSSSTTRRTHITLTSMLKAAMLDGHQVPARVLLVDAPGTSENDLDAMSDTEIEAVMAAAIALLPHWSRWLFQVTYGPRPAEARGLTWDEVDFETNRITIRWQLKQLAYVDKTDRSKGFIVPDKLKVRHLVDAHHLTAVKTRKGFRVAPMLPVVREALLEWREIAPESPYGLVWPALNGRPANDKQDVAEWYGLQNVAEISHPTAPRPFWMYEARHALATRLLEEGVDEKIITDLMGHSSIITSRGYQHVRQEPAMAAMSKVSDRLQLGRRALN